MLASCGTNLQLHSILSYEKTYEYGTSVLDINTAYSNVSWSVDGKALVTTTMKGKVDVLHLSKSGLKLVHNVSVPNSTTACFMKSSPRCIAVGTNTGEVVIWDCKKICEKNKFKLLSSYVVELDFNTADSYGAVLNKNGSITVFNCIQDCVVQTHQPPKTQLCCVRFHAKKRMLLGGTTLEGGVYFWDILSNKEVYSSPNSHSAPCVDLSFSHVNEVFAVTAGYDKVINLFDFSITKPAISTVVEFPCRSVSISNDGQKVAVGCSQSSIFIYDFRAFKNPIKRIDHVERVNKVVYQPTQKLEDTSSWLKNCEEKLYQRTDKSSPVLRGSIVVRKKSRDSNFFSNSPSSSHEKSGNSTGGSSFLINHSDVSLNISKLNLNHELFFNIGETSIANHNNQKEETSPIILKASEGDGSFIDCPIVSKENLINHSSVNLNTEKNNHSDDSAQESPFNSQHSEGLKWPKTVTFKNLNKIDDFQEKVIAKVSCKGPSQQLNDSAVLSNSSIDRKLSYSKTKIGHSLSKFTFSNSPNIQSMEPILSSPQSNTPKNIAAQKEVLKVTTSTPNENDSSLSIDAVDTPPHQEFQEAYSDFVGQVKTLGTQAEANLVGQVRSVGTQVEANLLENKLDVSELNSVLDMNRYDSHAMNVRLAILTEERLVNAIVPQIEALRLEMQQLRKTVHSLHRSKNSTKICYSKRYH